MIPRVGARALLLTGITAVAGGTFWFSRLTEHAGYAGDLLGPILLTSCGLGLVFVPLSLIALHEVADEDSGVASSMLNVGQQVGGAIGLALLGTVAWTAVANSVRTQAAKARTPVPQSVYQHALATGFSRGFVVATGIALLALLVAAVTIRIRRQDLTGAESTPQESVPPPASAPHEEALQPAMAEQETTAAPGPRQQLEDRAALAAAVRPCRIC